jgi:hypothetical protein
MPVKITVFYNEGSQGWSEIYYATTSVASINFTSSGVWKTWMQKRAACLASQSYIYGARVSNVGSPKQTALWPFVGNYQGTQTPPAGAVAVGEEGDIYPTVDVLCGADTSSLQKRSLWLRGAPSWWFGQLGGTGEQVQTPFVGGNLYQLFQAMLQCQLAIRLNVQPAAGVVSRAQVVEVVPATANPNLSTISVFASALTLPLNGSAAVRFLTIPKDDLPGFPSLATATGILTSGPLLNFMVPWRYRASVANYFPAKMTVQNLVYNYFPITQWYYKAISSHKTGRAFGVPRGRNRATVRAQ